MALRKLGLSGAAVARTMGVSTPAIIKAAAKGQDVMDELGWNVEDLLNV